MAFLSRRAKQCAKHPNKKVEDQPLIRKGVLRILKKIKRPNKWTERSFSWIGRVNAVEMSFLFRVIYRLDTIPIKSPDLFEKVAS